MIPLSKRRLVSAILAITMSGLMVVTHTFGIASSAGDQITPQLVQTVDLNATAARLSVLGANDDDNLSGNDAPDSFATFPRAHAVATGDFNNDGFDDLAIGAPEVDFTPVGGGARVNAGAVYVIFGKAFPAAPGTTTVDTNLTPVTGSQPEARIFGGAGGDNLGVAVAAGDINGDGISDLIMGANGANFNDTTPRADTGAVFVLFGSIGFPTGTIDLATPAASNVTIFGERTGDEFGSALAVGHAGGLTNIPDLLIGAPRNDGPADDRTNAGAAYVVFGATTIGASGGIIDLGATTAAVRIFGEAGSLLGSSVDIGDVNGAAPADLLTGAPLSDRPAPGAETETGAVFIFSGGVNLFPLGVDTSRTFDIASAGVASRPTVSIYGESADDHLGASVSTGDVTSDGNADILLGAPDADGRVDAPDEEEDAGEAYVLTGGTAINPVVPAVERRIDISLATAQLTIYGAATGDHFGSTVKAVNINTTGNNDTITDLAVGAPGFDFTAREDAGAVHVFFGGPTLLFFSERDLALRQDDFRVVGQAEDDELGWAIDSGDLDNNQGGDLIAGAPFHNVVVPGSTRPDAGRVYALLAESTTVPPVNQPPVVAVTTPNGGNTVSGGANFDITWTASDPNGDATIQRFEVRLSTNGGLSFNTIIASNVSGASRLFAWVVPIGLNTTTARIRITAFDDQDAQGQDDSNSDFTINDIGVTVALATPNGGDLFRFGQAVNITWTVPDAVANQVTGFDLFLSTNGGNNFNSPIAFTSPTQPALGASVRIFAWTVPSICTMQARVAVVARIQGGATTLDASNSNFTIQDNGPTIDTADMRLNSSLNTLTLKTTAPQAGPEIFFSQTATLEVSTSDTGTQFVSFKKTKHNVSGTKLIGKGQINSQSFVDFFPDQAIRFLRVNNPVCGTVLLKVQRQGRDLVVVP